MKERRDLIVSHNLKIYHRPMKWFLPCLALLFFFVSFALVVIGRGVTFTHGGYEEWDEAFDTAYRECCLATDLKTAAPFAAVGLCFLLLAIWRSHHERRLKNQSHCNL